MNIRTVVASARALLVLVLGTGVSLSADEIRLRSGKIVKGMFIGGDSKSVRATPGQRPGRRGPVGEATAVEFTPRTPEPATATPTPAPTPPRLAKR